MEDYLLDYVAGGFSAILIILAVSAVLHIGLAFIPAFIAKKKGYGFAGFYLFGFFFFLAGLIASLCLDNRNAQLQQILDAIRAANAPAPVVSANPPLLPGTDTWKAPEKGQPTGFCPNCGARLKPNAGFCNQCGTKLS